MVQNLKIAELLSVFLLNTLLSVFCWKLLWCGTIIKGNLPEKNFYFDLKFISTAI